MDTKILGKVQCKQKESETITMDTKIFALSGCVRITSLTYLKGELMESTFNAYAFGYEISHYFVIGGG